MSYMKRSSRFCAALHVLVHLAQHPERRFTSEEMATWWRTNPVVVRRTLGKLREVGLVESVTGPRGGWALARPPASIPLADIYSALEERIFPVEPDTATCLVEKEVNMMLADTWERMEEELHTRLRGISLAYLASRIEHKPGHQIPEEIHSHA